MRHKLRDSSSAYHLLDDGSVELVVYRRVERSMGTWNPLTFRGPTVESVERQYDCHCQEGYAKAVRQAERRARWGPLGTGRLT